MLRTVDRMILAELRGPFFFGVALFSMLTIATVALKEAANFVTRWDLPPEVFFTMLGLMAPQFIVLSIPMGSLMGTLLSVGRLSSDNEVVALRAAGISLYRVLAPYIIIGLLLSCLTLIGSERVVPYCMSTLNQLKNDVKVGKGAEISKKQFSIPVYDNEELRWVLVADEVSGTDLTNVLLIYLDPEDKYKNFTLRAESAEWDEESWTFYNLKQVMLNPSPRGDQQLVIEEEKLMINDFKIDPDALKLKLKTADDLTSIQLRKHIEFLLTQENADPNDKNILDKRTSLAFKLSIPFSPLFFIFIALPLAIMPQRSSRAMGMGMALLIVLVYYTLYTVCQKLGAVGALPPVIAAWVPNGILALVGFILMQRREHN